MQLITQETARRQIGARGERRQRQAGLSLIELLIGLAIGLFIIGGATKLFVDYLTDNRLLLLETRISQDLRTAADLIARDLRRAGYWADATVADAKSLDGATWPAVTNPYGSVTPTGTTTATTASYSYYNAVVIGYRRSTVTVNGQTGIGVIEAQTGAGWQQLSDPNTVNVTTFNVTPSINTVSLGASCTPTCAAGATGCPVINVRRYDITLTGQSLTDTRIQRTLRESVRVRNDQVPAPSCP